MALHGLGHAIDGAFFRIWVGAIAEGAMVDPDLLAGDHADGFEARIPFFLARLPVIRRGQINRRFKFDIANDDIALSIDAQVAIDQLGIGAHAHQGGVGWHREFDLRLLCILHGLTH